MKSSEPARRRTTLFEPGRGKREVRKLTKNIADSEVLNEVCSEAGTREARSRAQAGLSRGLGLTLEFTLMSLFGRALQQRAFA
jgi:hypothetical protein